MADDTARKASLGRIVAVAREKLYVQRNRESENGVDSGADQIVIYPFRGPCKYFKAPPAPPRVSSFSISGKLREDPSRSDTIISCASKD